VRKPAGPGRERGPWLQAPAAPPTEGRPGVGRPNRPVETVGATLAVAPRGRPPWAGARPAPTGNQPCGCCSKPLRDSPVTAEALGRPSGERGNRARRPALANQGGTAERPFRPWTEGALCLEGPDQGQAPGGPAKIKRIYFSLRRQSRRNKNIFSLPPQTKRLNFGEGTPRPSRRHRRSLWPGGRRSLTIATCASTGR
jgi:hypothetical protein